MGKVHRDLAVPIPAGAVAYRNGLVFDTLNGDKEVMLIGYAISNTEMNPNQNYFQFHREDWLAYNPAGQARLRPDTLEIGLYAALLGAAQKTGLLESLYEAFDFPEANAILDYGMAALRGDSPEDLGDSVTFHGPISAETWYADFFQKAATPERAQSVLERWVQRILAQGVHTVSLGVLSAPMAGAIWAVAADGAAAGLPVMCFPLAEGAVWTAVQWFGAYGIRVRDILWEEKTPGQSLDIPWAQVLDPSEEAFGRLLERYGQAVREDIHSRLERGLFGTAGAYRLPDGKTQRAMLLYRPVQGAVAATELLERVQETAEDLQAQIAAGENPVVPAGLEPYLALVPGADGVEVQIQEDTLQAAYRRQGYIGLAVSQDMDPREVAELLRVKETAERALALMPEGDASAGGMLVAWMMGVLQAVVRRACEAHGLAWGDAVPALRRVQYHLSGRSYRCGEEIPEAVVAALRELDITPEMLQDFAQEVSRRYQQGNGTLSRVYHNRLPWNLSKRYDEPSGSGGQASERSRGGRPRGKKDSYQRVRSTREQMEKKRRDSPPDTTKQK